MIQSLRRRYDTINWKKLLNISITLAVLFSAALVGWKFTPRVLLILAAALLGGLAYVFISRHMEWGVVAVPVATFLVPWTLSSGTRVPINLTILVLAFLFGIWVVQMAFIKRDIHLSPSPVNKPALLFLFSVTLSLIVGFFPLISADVEKASLFSQIGGWILYAFSIGGLLLVGNFLRKLSWLKTLTWIFLILGAFYTVLAWAFGIYRITSAFFNEGISTSVFWTLLAVIGTGQALFNRKLPIGLRLVAGGISAAGLLFGWVRGKEWIAGWLPPLLAVWILLWLRSWKLGMLVTVGALIMLIPEYSDLLAKVNTNTQQASSFARFSTWPVFFELFKASPVVGLGPANYFHYTVLYSYLGYHTFIPSHNNYIDIFAQFGLLGMGMFLWLVFALVRLALHLRKRMVDGFSQGYANSALAGLVGCLIAGAMADWFLPFLYNIGFAGFRTSILLWLFLGGLISLYVIETTNETKSQHRTPDLQSS